MKMLAIVLASFWAISTHATPPLSYSMTNVMAWVGVNINASNVSNLPYRMSTTPGDTVLGILRSFITNDCSDYLFHLTPSTRVQFSGTDNVNDIPMSYKTRYESISPDTNLCIMTCSIIQTNLHQVILSMRLHECSIFDETDDVTFFKVLYTNGSWRIHGLYSTQEECCND